MKKLFVLTIICMILLVGSVSAFEFDNKLTYSNEDLKVELTNWFGLGVDYGTAELKSHSSVDQVLQFGYGKEEVVMYYDYDFLELYEDGLGIVYLTDERTGKEIQKDYFFVYWTNETYEKNIYEEQCLKSINGTNVCENVFIRKENAIREVWKPYNSRDIPKGKIRIGLKTYVEKGDYIDAVWTIGGKKVERHATWEGGLFTDMYLYFRFEEASGNVIDSRSSLNTTTGATQGVTGKVGNATSHNNDIGTGTNSYKPYVASINAASVNFWINTSEANAFVITQDGSGNPNNIDTQIGFGGAGTAPWCGSGNFCLAVGASATVTTTDSNINDESWHMITITVDGTTHRMYIDGANVDNVTTGSNIFGGASGDFGLHFGQGNYIGLLDEMGIWNRSLSVSEINDLYNGGDGCVYGFNNCGVGPTVTLNSPIDFFNTTNSTINFNATISFGTPDSVTWFLNDVGNETNTTGIAGDYIFTKIIADGISTWNVQACDSGGCNNGTERTFTIDKSSPTINITFPTETIDYHAINTNLSVNWTVSDLTLDTCILQFEGVNKTVTCNDNQTQINITNSINKTIIFYVNDTLGNVNSSSRTWDYKIFQNSLNFSSSTVGGSTETFTLNITKLSSLQISLVNLVYNLSSSSATFTNGDNPIITKNLQIPNPTSDTNLSFFFSFLMSDSSLINTTSNNQTVLNFGIGNCTTFTTLVYNFTMLDEENQTKLSNVNIEYAFNLSDKDRVTQISSFSFESTENPTAICINQNLTSTSEFSLDGVLKYKSLNGSFLTRYYNILNFSLKNSTIPNLINIYSVLGIVATPFKLTFRDSSLTLSPNILVNVNKQFVASNDFKTVEIPITDTNGQTILNLVRNTAIYNLIFTDIQGNIVASFNKVAAFCQDFTIGDCVLNLDAPSTTTVISNISESLGISQIITYENSTSTATMTFSSLTSEAITARIIGTTQNQFGNSTVCDNSLTSTLGTIDCDASSILTTDNYLFIDIFSNGNYIETRVININPVTPLLGGNYGSNGFFIAFLMMLIIIILFSDDKQTLLIMIGIGWAVILVFGLVKGTIIGKTSAGIWLLITIITMIWKLKKEEVGT